jgi:hypothetical protein
VSLVGRSRQVVSRVITLNLSLSSSNAFPDVITKGLVSEAEARELWTM